MTAAQVLIIKPKTFRSHEHNILTRKPIGVACAGVPRPVIERQLAYWRGWCDGQNGGDPNELTWYQRQTLSQAVVFQIMLDKLALPAELADVPKDVIEEHLKPFREWFIYKG